MIELHTPEHVLGLAKEGRLEEWVHSFLRSVGGNVPLSDGLRLQERFWLGPAVIPLGRLIRCCGPEPDMEYVMEAASWERRITGMRNKIEQGWNPPPLIAQYLPDGTLSLRDGNHRHEALRRSGAKAYWCVVWCDSQRGWEEAMAQLGSM